MKRMIFPLLLLITGISYSQNPLQPMLKAYFRIHPFDMKFSTFILNLQKDPWFTIDEYSRRTDSTFFFLSGTYKNFNPFRYDPEQIKLMVVEQELIHTDSLHTHDTIVNIQLMAYTDTSSVNKNAAAKEFKHFHNTQTKNFYSTTYKNFDRNGATYMEMENYFVYPFSIPPVTVAWGPLIETHQNVFTITIRFKVNENLANYIAAPGEWPQ